MLMWLLSFLIAIGFLLFLWVTPYFLAKWWKIDCGAAYTMFYGVLAVLVLLATFLYGMTIEVYEMLN